MSFQILVVDDTKFMRKMLTDILKQYGHEVVGEAENGRQAVQKYEELQPDIVLMDITMPEMDGIEAMKEIRKLNPTAVVLICSAMSQQDLISDALKAGANGYVMKPFKPNRVNEIVRKYGVPRVIGQMIPQDMQRTEVVPAEVEVAETTFEKEELELQAKLAEGAAALDEGLHAVDQAYSEPEELLLTKQDEETLHEVASNVETNHEITGKLVHEEVQVPEVAELQQTIVEPEPVSELETKGQVVEERKFAAKPTQVVNALEVLLAFAEVEESKLEMESQEDIQMQDSSESALASDLDDRLLEMEIIAVAEQAMEEIAADIEASSIELSLEDLNDLTMEMVSLATMEAAQEIRDPVNEAPPVKEEAPSNTAYKSQEPADTNKVGLKALNGGKIINLNRGNGPMRNFTSSVMCNWSEELNGEMTQYLVVCTEAENKVEIEMGTAGGQKQSIIVTIESFNQIAAWLQVQLGTAQVSNREYAKKADF